MEQRLRAPTTPRLFFKKVYVLHLTGVSTSSTLKPSTSLGSQTALAIPVPKATKNIGVPTRQKELPNFH